MKPCPLIAALLLLALSGCAVSAPPAAVTPWPELAAKAPEEPAEARACLSTAAALPCVRALAQPETVLLSHQRQGAMALQALLEQVRQQVRDGEAGSTLRLCLLAGQLLDWQAAYAPEPEAVEAAALELRGHLSAEESAELAGKLKAVYAAALHLCSEEGASALEDCGYAPRSAPWDKAAAQSLFEALLRAYSVIP